MFVSKIFVASGLIGVIGMAVCTTPLSIQETQISKDANSIVNKFWSLNESMSKTAIEISKSVTNIC